MSPPTQRGKGIVLVVWGGKLGEGEAQRQSWGRGQAASVSSESPRGYSTHSLQPTQESRRTCIRPPGRGWDPSPACLFHSAWRAPRGAGGRKVDGPSRQHRCVLCTRSTQAVPSWSSLPSLFILILALSGRWWYWSTFQSEPKEIESKVLETIATGQMLGLERCLEGAGPDSRDHAFHIYFCVLRAQNDWSYTCLIK